MKWLLLLMTIIYAGVLCIHINNMPCEYRYNVYSVKYDEYFILKSYTPLPLRTTVYYDTVNATATTHNTGYKAQILSIYK